MFERPLLIFSEYCNHSVNFLNVLMKHPDLFDSFGKINIDIDPKTRRRPQIFFDIQDALNFKISEVPTVIINKGEYVLSGQEAFKWLEYEIDNLEKNKVLEGFNPNEMGSFSDSYSKFGSTELCDATSQSFKFIDSPHDKIYTPQEDSPVTQDDYNKKQRERDQSNSLSSIMQTRNSFTSSLMQNNVMPNTNSFQNTGKPNFFNQNTFDKQNNKQKEIDKRFQDLLMEREQLTPVQQPKHVDFASGNIQ